MNIQSLSICVPAKKCINDCKFCCSKMHGGEYTDRFTPIESTMSYLEDLRIRLQYARDNGCNTLMLTGNNEPQQNKDFLRALALVNKSLNNPFVNIEIQTSGAFIDENTLDFLKNIGITTIAISVACIDNDIENRKMIQTPDNNLSIKLLCSKIKERNMNLRICLNMNDKMITDIKNEIDTCKKIIEICEELNADQITCRALWTSEDGTMQAKWIKENVTKKSHNFITYLKEQIKTKGTYLETLEYGAKRYDFCGFSVVVDDDSMAKAIDKESVKYLILRPDGHLYTKWDTKASLLF